MGHDWVIQMSLFVATDYRMQDAACSMHAFPSFSYAEIFFKYLLK
jgi:hypothetical protein